MIVWSGRGWISTIVLLATLFLCTLILSNNSANSAFIISFFVAGVFSWFFGSMWNNKDERTFIDEKTGKILKIKNIHTLFWIPMQYWGIIFSIIAIVISFQSSLFFGIISALVLVAISTVVFMKEKSNSKTNSDENITTLKKNIITENETKKTTVSDGIISELKKENAIKKDFEPSDHNRFAPK